MHTIPGMLPALLLSLQASCQHCLLELSHNGREIRPCCGVLRSRCSGHSRGCRLLLTCTSRPHAMVRNGNAAAPTCAQRHCIIATKRGLSNLRQVMAAPNAPLLRLPAPSSAASVQCRQPALQTAACPLQVFAAPAAPPVARRPAHSSPAAVAGRAGVDAGYQPATTISSDHDTQRTSEQDDVAAADSAAPACKPFPAQQQRAHTCHGPCVPLANGSCHVSTSHCTTPNA